MAQAPPHVTAASWIGTQAFNAARAQQTGMERVPATGGRKNRGSRLPVRESGSSRQESLEVASAISLAGLACPQHRIDKNGVCSSLASQTSSAKTTFNAIKARLHLTFFLCRHFVISAGCRHAPLRARRDFAHPPMTKSDVRR